MTELQKFDKLSAELTLFVKPVMELKVSDKKTSEQVMDAAKQIKKWQKSVETLRKELVKPLNDEVKLINDYAKKISDPLLKAEQHVKPELLKWERVLEKKRQEELKKLEAEKKAKEEALKKEAEQKAKENEGDFASMFMRPEEKKREEISSDVEAQRKAFQAQKEFEDRRKEVEAQKVSGTRTIWKFELEDISCVPAEFLLLNEVAVRDHIRKGNFELPGVRIFQEKTLAIR